MRSYFIRNRFHFDMHAAYVIIRKSGIHNTHTHTHTCMCVFTTAAVVVLYAPMMWWYMVPTFCMIFSISLKLTLSVSLSHSHLAMASMRIIVLSTISQPQNESQRKTHFRAHFIMKIHTRAHTLYPRLHGIVYWLVRSRLKKRESESSLWFGKCVLNTWQICRPLSLSLSTSLAFVLFISYLIHTVDIGWHYLQKSDNNNNDSNSSIEYNRKIWICAVHSAFDIQHAFAHIFVLIISWKKK